jgi:hypothetical protein
MNALGPPGNEKSALLHAPKVAELLRSYSGFGFLQPAKIPVRRCVACGSRVTNQSLGGHDGRSALSGSLWCYDCADGRATP